MLFDKIVEHLNIQEEPIERQRLEVFCFVCKWVVYMLVYFTMSAKYGLIMAIPISLILIELAKFFTFPINI